MKINDLRKKICDIMIRVNEEKDLIGAADEIENISKVCSGTDIFKVNGERGAKAFCGMTAWDVYEHMLFKICRARNYDVALMAAILCFPYIYEKLTKERI